MTQRWRRDFPSPPDTLPGRRRSSLTFNLTRVDVTPELGPVASKRYPDAVNEIYTILSYRTGALPLFRQLLEVMRGRFHHMRVLRIGDVPGRLDEAIGDSTRVAADARFNSTVTQTFVSIWSGTFPLVPWM